MELEDYFEANAVDGQLSEADMAKLLVGDIGDTAQADSGKAPEPTTEHEVTEAPEGEGKQAEAEEVTPVVLAKNGKDVIPYEKLVEAREAAKEAKEANQALMQEMESIKQMLAGLNKSEQPQVEKPPEVEVDPLQDDLSRIKGQLEDLPEVVEVIDFVAKNSKAQQDQIAALKDEIGKLQGKIDPVIKTTEQQSIEAHFAAINNAHSDADTLVASNEFTEWKDKQPSFVKESFDTVLERGTSKQVIELFQAFKDATGWGKPAATTSDTVAQPKPEKVQTPTSLSDIPAGTAAPHDEAEALTQMSTVNLMNKLAGKSPAEIEDLMRRLV